MSNFKPKTRLSSKTLRRAGPEDTTNLQGLFREAMAKYKKLEEAGDPDARMTWAISGRF